jgi:hypothetical protein
MGDSSVNGGQRADGWAVVAALSQQAVINVAQN